MEANNEATGAEVDELIAKLSPEPAVLDPSRRRTEIYMKADDYKEHLKLREDVNDDMQPEKKKHEEKEQRTNDEKTTTTVDELIAANAATQATVAALAAENADIKALLTQLVQLQAKSTAKPAPPTSRNNV